MGKKKDWTGQKFNMLTLIAPTDRRTKSSKGGGAVIWEVRCDCGNTSYMVPASACCGSIKSCGCLIAKKKKEREESPYPFNTKVCINCKLEKTIDSFYWNRPTHAPRSECKDCGNIAVNDRRRKLQNIINDLKNSPCKDCDNIFPPQCMEFDHIRGEKDRSISDMLQDKVSLKKIMKEIEKTELVCILCHRTRTRERIGRNYSGSRLDNYNMIQSCKNSPCEACGIQYKPWQMDFDHKDPLTKNAEIPKMLSNSNSKIKEEMEKCILLCAVCHRLKSLNLPYPAKQQANRCA